MNFIKTDLKDVLIIEPKTFADSRGFFFESFNQKLFDEAVGKKVLFVQDNHSKSEKGVLRGLHFQHHPHAQGKLVRCIAGEVFDVVVDIRINSLTFGKWFGITLSAKNQLSLWIPVGFAHGFLTISDTAEFLYKTTNFYAPNAEGSIAWNDPTLNIKWPKQPLFTSDKDKDAKFFDKNNTYF